MKAANNSDKIEKKLPHEESATMQNFNPKTFDHDNSWNVKSTGHQALLLTKTVNIFIFSH